MSGYNADVRNVHGIRMARLRKTAFKIFAAVGGVIVALALAEGVVRVMEAQAAPSPSVAVHPVATDSLRDALGLRDRWDALPQDAAVTRIAFLGDSFTYGLGVEPHEAFAKQVGELLKERTKRWCVTVNLGRPGVDLITAWGLLNQVRDVVRPHVVVHVMTQDDLTVDLYEEGKAIEEYVTERLWPSRYSRLFDRIETSIRWSRATPRILNNLRGGATEAQRQRAWRIAEFQIRAIRRLVEEAGGVYVLVRFPCLRWMGEPESYPLRETRQKTAALAEKLDVPYVDLFDAFAGKDPAAMCLTPSDDHPTPEGHKIAAEAIADFLVGEVLPGIEPGATSRPTSRRSPAAIRKAEIRQYERILELDPTCESARFWLERARGGR